MSRRAPRDANAERWVDFAQDTANRIGGLVREFVPPEAQMHLLNAQRELLTALFLIYEHQAQGRGRSETRRKVGRRESATRLHRIDID